MKEFIDLLIQYWKPIVGLLFTIAGFIIALFKKKPISDILTDIYYCSIIAINETELLSNYEKIDPEVKLARAVESVVNNLKDKYPTLDVNKYISLIKNVIEEILATPHKKV